MFSKSRALFLLFALAAILAGGAESARAACLPDPPADGDAVVCDGVDSDGYDGSAATGLTITTLGMAVLTDADGVLDSAILVGDNNTVTIGAGATVTVMNLNGFGIRGNDTNAITNQGLITVDGVNGVALRGVNDNIITNDTSGTIVINGSNGRGIFLDENTTGILPNGGVNSGTITVSSTAIGSFAIESGDNAGVATIGTITLNADNSRGLSAGNRSNPLLASNLSNFGLIDVNGIDSYGIKAGDGWIQGAIVGQSGVSQGALFTATGSTINVVGMNSYGIYMGDDLNMAGNNNSFARNAGTIDVTGADAIGVSLGGQDLLDPFDIDTTNSLSIVSFANIGTIMGGPNAGPLIEFRSFVAGRENSVANDAGGRILANISLLGTANRGIAIRGSAGDEFILNRSEIVGDVELNAGNDTYVHDIAATLTESVLGGSGNDRVLNHGAIAGTIDLGSDDDTYTHNVGASLTGSVLGGAGSDVVSNLGDLGGMIDLGAGNDTYSHAPGAVISGLVDGGADIDVAVLESNSISAQSFDPTGISNFETLEIGGGTFGWELVNAAGFMGLTEIAAGGLLRVPTPITLGGDFLASSTGTLDLTIDGSMTPALTVGGNATFAGDLVVRADLSVMPGATPLPAVAVTGVATGQFRLVPISGNQLFTATQTATGVTIQLVSRNSVGVASGSSERAIAQHLDDIDAIGSAEPTLQRLLDEFDGATGTLNDVFRALSPEIYDAHTTVIVDGGRRVSNLLFDRPRECQSGDTVSWQSLEEPLPCHARNWSPWLAAIGGVRTRESFGDHGRYDAQLGGLVFGVDVRPIESLDLTLAVSSQRGTIDGKSRGKSTITLTDLSGHAAWNRGPLRVQGTVGWGHGFHQDRRRVRFAETGLSTIDVRGVADHDSDRISIAGEVGYVFDVGPVKIEPIGGLDWAWVYQRPIHEDETSGLGIRIASRDDSIGSINGGVRVSTSYLHSKYLGQQLLWMDGVWKPSIEVRWRQMLTGYEREIDARLQGAPDGVSDFTIEGREDPGGAEIAAGISFTPKNANRLQFDIRYEAFLSSHTVAHDLIARAQIGF